MPKIKRFLALVCCLVVVVLAVPVRVHADPLTAGAAASIFQMWAQSYGMSVGGATFGFSGVDSSEADTWITDTFNSWQSYEVQHGQSSAISLSDFISSYSIYSLTEKVFGTSTVGSGYVTMLKIGSALSEKLDDFWNWYLQSLGFVYDSASGWVNSLFSDDAFLTLYSIPNAGPIYQSSDGVYNSQWTFGASYRSGSLYVASSGSPVFCLSSTASSGADMLIYVGLSANEQYYRYMSYNSSYGSPRSGTLYTFSDVDFYYAYVSGDNISNIVFPFITPADSNVNTCKKACEYVYGIMEGTIDNSGADITLDTYGDNEGVLDFPKSNDNPDYIPADVNIPLNIPWGDTWDTLTQDELMEEAAIDSQTISLTNELELVEPMDTPAYPDTDVIGPAGDYVVPGLSTVFPFCIPFDIYNFLSALAAEPAAPSFSCTLAFPAQLGGPQTVEIDFDTPVFNQLASLLRLLELLAFIVGLAFVTRSMFIRG